MSGQSAFDEKNILKSAGENRGLLDELHLPPQAISFVRKNARNLQIAVVCLILALVGWSYYGNYTKSRNDKAAFLLAEAMKQTTAEQKLASLKDLADKYSGSGPAIWGKLEIGHLAYDDGKYAEAAKTYEEVLAEVSSSSPLVPLIRFNLAQAYEGSDQADKALPIYENFSSLKGFNVESQLAAARILEKQGKPDKAKEIYSKLLAQEELPSGIKEILESKLAEL